MVVGRQELSPRSRSSFSLCGLVESNHSVFSVDMGKWKCCQMIALLGVGSVSLISILFVCEVCVKMCDPAKGAAGQKTIAVLLPCLLDKGMMSPVTEVRALRFESADEMNVLDLLSYRPSSRNWVS